MSDFAGISAPPTGLLDGASLFLDLDGTLLELADTPEEARAGPEVMSLLALASARLSGRLAIVSGRSAVEIAALLPGFPLNVGGSHGLELIWSDGRRHIPRRPAALDHVLAEMRALERRHDGLLVEDKPFGVALHYRLAPHLADACSALAERLGDDANDEAGFAAAAQMAGCGILVGPERATAARWRLPSVAGTLAWLRAEMEALP
jgi:trehalose 6-phosphate phosphatase